MKPAIKTAILLLTLLTLAGLVQPRILPQDYTNNHSSRMRLLTSASLKHSASHSVAETICRWLGYWAADEIKFVCNGLVKREIDDLGRNPRPGPPAPRAGPGSRP
ncbi:ATP synthase protein 8 [Striga asiatica]|uniref:ATP synthase protein 8 n=1 Tax=Striga asiatica TaxID=4170 RepID=A0A5A7QTI3_STRAF|nr:ATP synthase protein 8 [Striga asiatica]